MEKSKDRLQYRTAWIGVNSACRQGAFSVSCTTRPPTIVRTLVVAGRASAETAKMSCDRTARSASLARGNRPLLVLREFGKRRPLGIGHEGLLARQRFGWIVRVDGREHDVQERVERPVGTERQRHARGARRLHHCETGSALGSEPRVDHRTDHEMRRILNQD